MNDIKEFFTYLYKEQHPNASQLEIERQFILFSQQVDRLFIEYVTSPYYKNDWPS